MKYRIEVGGNPLLKTHVLHKAPADNQQFYAELKKHISLQY